MGRRVRTTLLCEDDQHERLLRPVLENKYGPRSVDARKRGNFDSVLDALPDFVDRLRRSRGEAASLVVAIDGDVEGFDGRRLKVLRKAELKGKNAPLAPQIAICVLCRNVETWILWLNGENDLDESTDYKDRVRNDSGGEVALARQAAKAWFDHDPARREQERTRLPALAHGRAEIDRLEKLTKA